MYQFLIIAYLFTLFHLKFYDKRDDFDFDIMNFPFLDGDVPRSTFYGVYISQFIRFARVSRHVTDFNARGSGVRLNDGPDIKLFILVFGAGAFLSVAWPTGVQLLVFFCSSVPVLSFDTPGVGRNTLFLSSPHLCFIIVFICDLFVSRDDPLRS